MSKRFIIYTMLVFSLIATNISVQSFYKNIKTVIPIERINQRNYWLKIVLMPLDSRPACTQFVKMLADISEIQVISPPQELLDNYKEPADRMALKEWLKEECKSADAAIVSVDMLTHGSLLASRLSTGSAADSLDTLLLLRTIHTQNPRIKIYAFNIIPRLLLAESSENTAYQKKLLKYSILKDQLYTFENPRDMKKLAEVESQIPHQIISNYNAMYFQNTKVNAELANLVEEGALAGLVIGQDDGMPFGIPNINKQKIQHLTSQLVGKDKITITRGTDEVALTLLGRIITDYSQYYPRVFVIYSDQDAPEITMPYMPNTVATTVQEKLALVKAQKTTDINEANFVLYVHIGTEKNRNNLPLMAKRLKQLIDQGHKVALVDLSENFTSSQTLLPWLATNNTDVTKLIAYAGWNTTSNSIGTAVTQAVAFCSGLNSKITLDEKIRLYQNNLEFLTARFLDDWYFQKDVQPYVNNYLKSIKADPYNLAGRYDEINRLVDNMMQSKAQALFHDYLDNHEIVIETDQGTKHLYITSLTLTARLPWARTFEVYVAPQLVYGLYD